LDARPGAKAEEEEGEAGFATFSVCPEEHPREAFDPGGLASLVATVQAVVAVCLAVPVDAFAPAVVGSSRALAPSPGTPRAPRIVLLVCVVPLLLLLLLPLQLLLLLCTEAL